MVIAGATTIETVAAADVAEPSVARYENVSVPAKLAAGVYVNDPSAFNVRVPLDGPETSTALSEGLSTSVSLPSTPGAATLSATPWPVAYESGRATGASLTGVTVTVT